MTVLVIAAPWLLAQSFSWGGPSWGEASPDVDAPYWSAQDAAVRTGKPLVVGIGCEPPAGEWLTCRVAAPWHDWKRPCVILARPDGGRLDWLADLPTNVSTNEVRRRLAARATSPMELQRIRTPQDC